MRMLRYFLLSSILLAAPLFINAQENEEGKKRISFSFNGISLSADVFGLAYSLLDSYSSSEASLEANIGNRIYPIVEAGYGWCNTTDETTEIHYKTAAPYFRVGLNYNFSTTRENPDPKYSIFGIARYGFTMCKYDVKTPPVTDPIWGGSTALDLTGVKGRASWAEVGVGIRVKIAKFFHMGWTIRYKARINQKKGPNSQLWYIPGYGINKSTGFGGTYNFIFEIPFK
ncbi:MAG: hypothetical protein IJF06_00790 [Bacteroidaceae bacterium]|nr:hypothetical protein [Bacteroidaceae bacterium]